MGCEPDADSSLLLVAIAVCVGDVVHLQEQCDTARHSCPTAVTCVEVTCVKVDECPHERSI